MRERHSEEEKAGETYAGCRTQLDSCRVSQGDNEDGLTAHGTPEDDLVDDGHRNGNFKHYYEFHTASRDRFKGVIPGSFYRVWQSIGEPTTFTILDVGCNEGDLTAELLHMVREELPAWVCCEAHGLDFDRVLIDVAVERHKGVNDLFFSVVDVMDGGSLQTYLSSRDMKSSGGDGSGCSNDSSQGMSVSLVACLRVSMWVHLNSGDEGLSRLLHLLGACSTPAPALLLDPQKYSYYKKTISRNEKLRRPPFPYSLSELSVGGANDLPAHCVKYYGEEFGLSELLHRDIVKWGGTLLFLMRGVVGER